MIYTPQYLNRAYIPLSSHYYTKGIHVHCNNIWIFTSYCIISAYERCEEIASGYSQNLKFTPERFLTHPVKQIKLSKLFVIIIFLLLKE